MFRLIYFVIIAATLIISGCGGTESIPEKGNTKNESFIKAKNLLLNQVYNNHRVTFYCGCNFTKNKKVRCKTGEGERARRIEWEHIVPASQFGRTFDSWKKYTPLKCRIPSFIRKLFSIKCKVLGGRENARRVSKLYRLMESDMYNLAPAIGLINQRRLNYPYRIIPGEKREFGNCDFEVSKKTAEPSPHVRGDIARTYFYMNEVYPGRNIMSEAEKREFQMWDKEDPVDEWECERCKKIESLQGNINSFVKKPCQKKGFAF
ncbi:endonuclease [Desulfonema magnum]|uniref:Endonuclease family protein n=1 Tax=Desulfonema magnum TaxID=45655 RepID=A0A975BQG1_9BACT|nr:endonuclease [Desulfonema magnum]QTA89319.1 Endonuclease family protein [Desulfonema magnum]